MASKNFLLLSRRAYSVAAENVKLQKTTSVMGKAASESTKEINSVKAGGEKAQQVFWMRDPKTGNYIPESHFDQIDAADLRHKFLSKKLVKPPKT